MLLQNILANVDNILKETKSNEEIRLDILIPGEYTVQTMVLVLLDIYAVYTYSK